MLTLAYMRCALSTVRGSTVSSIRDYGAGPTDGCQVVAWFVENHARDGRCLRRLGVDKTRFCLRPGYPFAPIRVPRRCVCADWLCAGTMLRWT